MAWSASKMFVATLEAMLEKAANAPDMDSDTFKAALYDDDITPDNTVALANTAYGAGQWVSAGNEQYDGTNWDQGGEPLTGVTSGFSGAVWTFDAIDTPQGGATVTIPGAYGCLVYSDTSAGKYGFSYNYFGGQQTVTAGTFTIQWAGTGIGRLTLT